MSDTCKCGHLPKDHDKTYGCGAIENIHYGAGAEDVRECQCEGYEAARPAPAGSQEEGER